MVEEVVEVVVKGGRRSGLPVLLLHLIGRLRPCPASQGLPLPTPQPPGTARAPAAVTNCGAAGPRLPRAARESATWMPHATPGLCRRSYSLSRTTRGVCPAGAGAAQRPECARGTGALWPHPLNTVCVYGRCGRRRR